MADITFRDKLKELSRERLLDIIRQQDIDDGRVTLEEQLYHQVQRIEWVFENKLRHLNWRDGTPITERPLSNEELAYLIDEPFIFSKELLADGFNIEDQKALHIANDSVLWAKTYLGVRPRAYQILIMRHPGTRKVLRAGRRLGKALALDTPIPTPIGWKKMGDLQSGDQVFDENGYPCNIIAAHDTQLNKKCYDVIFSDGSVITADAEHLWMTHTKKYRQSKHGLSPQVFTTQQICDSLYVNGELNHAIPVAGPLYFEEKQLSISPYVLGVWLSNGMPREASIRCFEQELINNIKTYGYELTQNDDSSVYTIEGLSANLNAYNLFDNKEIPESFLQSSIKQRQELLSGLMDAGGVIYVQGVCEFPTTNKKLANDIYDLIVGLGMKPTMQTENIISNDIVVGEQYTIVFVPHIPIFKLFGKANRVKLPQSKSSIQYRYITQIQERPSVPVRCIEVDSPNKLFLAGKNCIPTHNTWSMSAIMLHYAFTHNNGRVIVVAPMKSQVELIYKEVLGMAAQSQVVQQAISRAVTSPQFTVEMSNGSTIRFFTSGVRSGGKADVVRGQEAHIIVLDEVDYMHNDDLESLYAMLQKTNENQIEKIMIGASTPSGRRETFWSWCNSSEIWKEFWFPSYVNPFFDADREKELRVHYTEMGYRHEVEADWGEDSEGVYPRKYVDMAFNVAKTLVGEEKDVQILKRNSDWKYVPVIQSTKSFFTIGVDWDKYGAGTNIVILEICDPDYDDPRFRNRIRLYHREEIPKDEFTLTNAVDRIIELNRILQPRHIYIDRGYGDVQVELLHKYGSQHPETQLRQKVKGVQFAESIKIRDPGTKELVKKDIKPFMVENLKRSIEQSEIFFPSSDEELYLQLISYVVARTSVYGRPVFEATGKSGDHIHDALILALYAVVDNYSDLLKIRVARMPKAISNEAFLPVFVLDETSQENKEKELEMIEKAWGSVSEAPIAIRRALTVPMGRSGNGRKGIRRKMF